MAVASRETAFETLAATSRTNILAFTTVIVLPAARLVVIADARIYCASRFTVIGLKAALEVTTEAARLVK